MKIRQASEQDTPQLEELFLITRRQTFAWENPDQFKLGDYKKKTEGEVVFVADDEHGKILGFISVWEKDAFPFVHNLFVASAHQRKGVGEALIRSLFSWLPRPYRLKCVIKNQNAMAFYRKNNWIEVGRGVSEHGEYLLLELPAHRPFSKIVLSKATEEDKATIQNLGRYYVYEMSRYCGFLPTWETPPNGLFKCFNLSSYFKRPDRHPFLIKVDDELAGFVLINKVGSTPDVDWNMGEFFVVAKFQGKGVGRYAAEQVFNQFPGTWEIMQIPENKAAIDFWEKVVAQYAHGQFEKTYKIILKPTLRHRIVLKFTAIPLVSEETV